MKKVRLIGNFASDPIQAVIGLEQEINDVIEEGYVPFGSPVFFQATRTVPAPTSTEELPVNIETSGIMAIQPMALRLNIAAPVIVPGGVK